MFRVTLSFVMFVVVSLSFAAVPEAYPVRPVRIVVPFSAGGGSDAMARMLAPQLIKMWGQQVVVDNRPGGATIIGSEIVATAPPDGHTLLLANANHTINSALYRKLPYDTERDFTPVTPVANVTNVLIVHAAVPAKSVEELVALAKAKPGQLNFASPGNGSASHLAGALLQSMAKIDFVIVPYKGAGPSLNDLLGGQVSMAIAGLATVLPQLKAGKVRALGVTTAQRSRLMPDLPTIAESGLPGYEVTNWYGILTSRGTPRQLVGVVNKAMSAAVATPEFQNRMASQGLEPFTSPPEAFAKFLAAEMRKWTRLVADFGIKPD